jgi:hypothetical protein
VSNATSENLTVAIFNMQQTNPVASRQLYRPSDLRLSAKLVLAFVDKGCRVVSAANPYGRILDFLDRRCYYFFQIAPQLYSRG